MNAVEAIEQLAAMGRRIRVKELSLQQPAAVLHLAEGWAKLLVDPVASLTALLAETGAIQGQGLEAETEITTARVPAAFAWQDTKPPPSGGDAWRSDMAASQSGEVAPVESVRLARKQASLLSILNANLGGGATAGERGHEGVPAVPHEGVRATPDRVHGVESRDPRGRAQWENESIGQKEGVDRPVFTGAAEMEHPDGQRGDVGGRLRQGAPEQHIRVEAVRKDLQEDLQEGEQVYSQAGMGAADAELGSGVAKSGQHIRGDLHRAVPAPPNGSSHPHKGMRDSHEGLWATQLGLPVDGQTGVWTDGVQGDWSAASAAPAEPWATVYDTGAERSLSMAQIDQVLDALDERLELMLLRMYGTSGGAV